MEYKMYNDYDDYIRMIGDRIKAYRVNLGLTQQDLEDRSGVSKRSISRLEQGATIQLDNLMKILIALRLDDNIELLIPDQRMRPSSYLRDGRPKNIRARKSKKNSNIQWGDGR